MNMAIQKSATVNVRREPTLQDRLARSFRLRKSAALRVVYFLRRLFDMSVAHGEVAMVPYRLENCADETPNAVIGTVDWKGGALGCALCGEHAADSGGKLGEGFKLVVLCERVAPADVRGLGIVPALVYCESCFLRWEGYLRERLAIA